MSEFEQFLKDFPLEISPVKPNNGNGHVSRQVEILGTVLKAIAESPSKTATVTSPEPYDPSTDELEKLAHLLKGEFQKSFGNTGAELYCEIVPWEELGEKSRLEVKILKS